MLLRSTVLSLLFFTILTLISTGCETSPPTGSIDNSGKIVITTDQPGAMIYVDSVFTGKYTPDTITLSVGNHVISLLLMNPSTLYSRFEIKIVKGDFKTISKSLTAPTLTKTVLIEDFANVSCVPCVISNKILYSLKQYSYNTSKLVAIKFPTYFPGPNDLFYNANKPDCDSRIAYYSIMSAPTQILNGTSRPAATDSNKVKAAIEVILKQPAKFTISVKKTFFNSKLTADITISLFDSTAINFNNLVLHTVVIEEEISFPTPPGSNGETNFYDVMRAMLPNNQGESVASFPLLSSKIFHREITLNSNWNTSMLRIVAYLQDKTTKEVFQVAQSD